MTEWIPVKLGDLISLRGGLSYKASHMGGTGHPLITMGCVTPSDRFKRSGLKFYTGDYRKTHVVNPGELVISTRDVTQKRETLGAPAMVPNGLPGGEVIAATNLYIVRNESDYSNRFLYWLLKTPEYRRHIIASAKGTTVLMLTKDAVENYVFQAPPEPERSALVGFLDDLQDKIEVNRRINEILEVMAQAIFRDWFVDFGPTQRKMEGATDPVAILGGLIPSPEKATSLTALFPATLGDNGLPEGWEPTRINQVMELAYGKSLTKKDRTDGNFPVYGSGGVNGTHNAALVKGPGIIVGRKGTVGSLYWEERDFYPIDTVFYVKPFVPLNFAYYLLQTLGLENMNTDAAVPGLNRNNVYRLDPPVGCEATRSAFADIVDVLRGKISQGIKENQTLAATRDLLLPKLMSGEIRLRDVEAVA